MNSSTNTFSDSDLALLPDQILDNISIVKPEGYVIVRGEVKNLTTYDDKKWCYGTLDGVATSIRFKCPYERRPKKEGDTLTFGGKLDITPARNSDGFQVRINGNVIGAWEKDYDDSPFIIPKRPRPSKLGLEDFIRTNIHSLEKLLILSTPRGLTDYRAALVDITEVKWIEETIKVVDPQTFFNEAEPLISQYEPDAIVIMRGGADDLKSMRLWDDTEVVDRVLSSGCALYSAIGHADGFVALDKYADESFTSPTQFGECLKKAINKIHSEIILKKQYLRIDNERASLDEELRNELENAKITKLKVDNKLKDFSSDLKSIRLQRNIFICLAFIGLAATSALKFNFF